MHLLCGHHRKAPGEVESHLIPEQRQSAGAGAIVLAQAFFADPSHEIEILPHWKSYNPTREVAAILASFLLNVAKAAPASQGINRRASHLFGSFQGEPTTLY